jgi:hypothetical protein
MLERANLESFDARNGVFMLKTRSDSHLPKLWLLALACTLAACGTPNPAKDQNPFPTQHGNATTQPQFRALSITNFASPNSLTSGWGKAPSVTITAGGKAVATGEDPDGLLDTVANGTGSGWVNSGFGIANGDTVAISVVLATSTGTTVPVRLEIQATNGTTYSGESVVVTVTDTPQRFTLPLFTKPADGNTNAQFAIVSIPNSKTIYVGGARAQTGQATTNSRFVSPNNATNSNWGRATSVTASSSTDKPVATSEDTDGQLDKLVNTTANGWTGSKFSLAYGETAAVSVVLAAASGTPTVQLELQDTTGTTYVNQTVTLSTTPTRFGFANFTHPTSGLRDAQLAIISIPASTTIYVGGARSTVPFPARFVSPNNVTTSDWGRATSVTASSSTDKPVATSEDTDGQLDKLVNTTANGWTGSRFTIADGETLIPSVMLAAASGTPSVQLEVENLSGGTYSNQVVTLSTTPTRYYLTSFSKPVGNGQIDAQIAIGAIPANTTIYAGGVRTNDMPGGTAPACSPVTGVTASATPTTINSSQTSALSSTVSATGTGCTVTWSIVSGGGSIAGTTYTAPTVTAATTVTVRATSVQDATKFGNTTITVNPIASTTTTYTSSSADMKNPERGFRYTKNVYYNPTTQTFENAFYSGTTLTYLGAENLGINLDNLITSAGETTAGSNRTVIEYNYSLEGLSTAIPTAALNQITSDLADARTRGYKVVILFSYCFNVAAGGPFYCTNDGTNGVSATPREPAVTQVLAHIDQLATVLTANADVIAFLRAGMVGQWGEWNRSKRFPDIEALNNQEVTTFVPSGTTAPTAATITDAKSVTDRWLLKLPSSMFVANRYQSFKRVTGTGYGFNTALTSTEGFSGTAKARLAHFNDCYNINDSNSGTYWAPSLNAYKQYLQDENQYMPQSGEECGTPSPIPLNGLTGSPTLCQSDIADFSRMRWSVFEGSNVAITELGFTNAPSCLAQVRNSLGYRLRVTETTIPNSVQRGTSFNMSFKVVNDGWASPYNQRKLEIVLRSGATVQRIPVTATSSGTTSSDPRRWLPGQTYTVSVSGVLPGALATGSYDVLMNLPDPNATLANSTNNPKYAIRLASLRPGSIDGWESSTGFNLLASAAVNVTP